MPYTIPDPTEPTGTPISVYGNNATVACPCGRVIVVRSLGAPGGGSWRCSCHRSYKGYPEGGHAITHILIWNVDSQNESPDYRVTVLAPPQ